MINEEFEAMLLAAYGNQEIPPDQKQELRLAFLRGCALAYTATVASVLATTASKNVTQELHAEISAQLKAAGGPSIVLDAIELKSAPVGPTPEERITKLVKALADLIGSDQPEELKVIEHGIRLGHAPDEDAKAMIDAIHTLLAELPPTIAALPPEAGEAPSTTSAE